jgi:hypothetical protein
MKHIYLICIPFSMPPRFEMMHMLFVSFQARLVKDESELGLNLDSLAVVEILIKITDVTKR